MKVSDSYINLKLFFVCNKWKKDSGMLSVGNPKPIYYKKKLFFNIHPPPRFSRNKIFLLSLSLPRPFINSSFCNTQNYKINNSTWLIKLGMTGIAYNFAEPLMDFVDLEYAAPIFRLDVTPFLGMKLKVFFIYNHSLINHRRLTNHIPYICIKRNQILGSIYWSSLLSLTSISLIRTNLYMIVQRNFALFLHLFCFCFFQCKLKSVQLLRREYAETDGFI